MTLQSIFSHYFLAPTGFSHIFTHVEEIEPMLVTLYVGCWLERQGRLA